jgi:hemolysin activation/secretion protein
MKKSLYLLTAVAVIAANAPAAAMSEQWLTRYAPPLSNASSTPAPVSTDSTATRPEAQKQQVVIKNLRGVALVDKPTMVRKRGASVEGVSGDPEVFPARVTAVAEAYLGKPLTFGDLDQLTRDLVLAFRAENRPVVNVVAPEQDVTNGTLQILVVVGRLSAVRIEGARAEDVPFFAREATLAVDEPVDEGAVLDTLRYLNRNPFRAVSALYQPGKRFGETEVVFNVNQQKPWIVYGGVETKGDRGPLGVWRPFAGFMLHNTLGLDEVFGYQFTMGEDLESLRSHVVSLNLPLMSRYHLLLTYGRSDSTSNLPNPLIQKGVSDVAGAYLTAPLRHWGRVSHDLRFGAEYKASNNNLDFGGNNVTDTKAVAIHGVVGYSGELISGWGVTRFDANAYFSPGDLGSGNNDTAFNALRAGAKSNYVYARATIDHRYDFSSGWRLVQTLTGQASDQTLLPSETLLLGGVGSVRGFTFGKQRADSGIVSNTTIYTPALSLLQGAGGFNDQLRFYAFYDAAFGRNQSPTAVDMQKVKLAGVGVGISYDLAPHASLDLGYGWRVEQTANTPKDNGAVHFRLTVRY